MSQIDLSTLGDVDLTTVETGIPILAPGTYPVTVVEMELGEAKKGGGLLTIKLGLTEPCLDEKGQAVQVGFPMFDRVSLVPKDTYNPARRLAELQDCFTGRKAGFDTDDFTGAVGSVIISIEEEKGEYPRCNRIKRYVKA